MKKQKIIILTGDKQDMTIDIQGILTIGRDPENTLQFHDPEISRKHAVIEQKPEYTILRDLNSANGTFIGNEKISEHKLTNGDEIKIGSQKFRFEIESDEVAEKIKPGSIIRFKADSEANTEGTNAADIYDTFFGAPKASATEEQLRKTQQRLQAVYSANEIITSEQDLAKLFERVMNQIFALIPAHNGAILLRDEKTSELVTKYVKAGPQSNEVTISSSIVKRAFENGEAVITYDASDDSRFNAKASILIQHISSVMCVPLTHQKECLGVIYVDTRRTTNAFLSSDLELLVALAGPSAIAIKNAQYLHMVEQGYQETLKALANAIELRDHYTVGHTWRVTNFSVAIAREMGWPEEKIKEVQMGGVLHDVGKIAVPDAILQKPGKLTDEEFGQMKIHPEKGARLLQDSPHLSSLVPYCLYHHERYDGKGYPFGLKGSDIPIEGRIVSAADTMDAMTSNRPYRKGLAPEIAINEIEKESGKQFDPECASAIISCFRAGKLDSILQDYNKQSERSIVCPFCSTYINLNDQINAGDAASCDVCHKELLILKTDGNYYAELILQSKPVNINKKK